MSGSRASQPTPSARRELLDVAVEAATRAADEIRRRGATRTDLEWRRKSRTDFVSDVDVAAEEALRDVITREVPEAVILGEELSSDATPGAITFVIDPLDGTTNFLHGVPAYAVSVGVAIDGELAAGAVLDVPDDMLSIATLGGGARCNGEPIHVSDIDDPSLALIGTGFPFKTPEHLVPWTEQFKRIALRTSGVRRPGAASLDLVDVALGRFDAFWELILAPWDFAAGALIIREAGGIITNLSGADPGLRSSAIVAGNPAMHAWLLATLAA
jgi:myo-inositol-1(or 4)-monophosphatase